ncbi:MAG: hypothetical protein GWO44_10590 [Thermoplasmata archaeon]|nr:hypothetical protein [Thermoplasmata archaeon]NIY03712.1 hypothetical protein [Thermoplasmata archaeon]
MAYKNPEDEKAAKRRWYRKNAKKVKARARANNEIYRKRNQEYVRQIKASTPCADCGNHFHFCVMDFDHVTDDKEGAIADMVRDCCSLERINREIEKCEIVCSNCHRLRTWKRLGSPTEEAPDSSPGQ